MNCDKKYQTHWFWKKQYMKKLLSDKILGKTNSNENVTWKKHMGKNSNWLDREHSGEK